MGLRTLELFHKCILIKQWQWSIQSELKYLPVTVWSNVSALKHAPPSNIRMISGWIDMLFSCLFKLGMNSQNMSHSTTDCRYGPRRYDTIYLPHQELTAIYLLNSYRLIGFCPQMCKMCPSGPRA